MNSGTWGTGDSCTPGLHPDGAPVVILGAGGLARELLGICYDLGVEDRVRGFVDPAAALQGVVLDGKPVLGDDDWLADHVGPPTRFLVGIGDNALRRQITMRLEDAGMRPATLVSPYAVVSRFAQVLPGSVICPGAIVSTNVTVGSCCVVNPATTLGHDAQLSAYVHLAPGARISGWVSLGEGVYIGTGAAVSERVSVGEWTVVGSMAAVVRDLPANVTAVGVPARAIKASASDET